MFRKNVASQTTDFLLRTAQGTTVTSGTFALVFKKDAGEYAAGTGTGTYKATGGTWQYTWPVADTNADHIAAVASVTGALNELANIYPVTHNATTGLPSVDVGAVSGDSTAADNLEAIFDGTGGVTLGYFTLSGVAAGQHGLSIVGGAGMDGLRLAGGGIGGWSLNVTDYINTASGIRINGNELYAALVDRTLLAAQYGTAANQTTIMNRIGAFLGSGTNTIYGWLRSLFRKDVATPSDIGGSYSAATDSLEAIRDYAGTGTSVLTTSDLDAMATQLKADLAAAHGAGTWGATEVDLTSKEITVQSYEQ